MSDFPPPPPWTAGFRAQQAAKKAETEQTSPPRKSRGDKWEWLILVALLALVVGVLVLK
ncbi:hypothetical protein DFR67_11434 [Williamsia limnetica]|uniref:Uncharacterized protein n=1 Tax=Williamsia limnetica TaxID=882452 RepID=A0A318RDM7_WILLI|nr:hypothetical protein [Williamsia limnetica]PYE13940.1 hypothetical protein DFR67_11434 [Williamsia limnetica]